MNETNSVSVGEPGLGFNLLNMMVLNLRINLKTYSMYLDDKETSTGSLLFGGIDTKKVIGSLKVVPVNLNSKGTWSSFNISVSSTGILTQAGQALSLTNSTLSLPVFLDCGDLHSYLPLDTLSPVVAPAGGAMLDRDIFVDYNLS